MPEGELVVRSPEAAYVHEVCEQRLDRLIQRKGALLDRLALLADLKADPDQLAYAIASLQTTTDNLSREHINVRAD